MTLLHDSIAQLADGEHLSAQQSREAFEILMSGEANDIEITAFLVALRVKGETADEIYGAAKVMRSKALTFSAPDGTVDTCGTGGDAHGTVNISTAAAIIAAAAGAKVAKHGNRSVSSKSGSADVLEKLGVRLDVPVDVSKQSLDRLGICFLMAPNHHQAVRHVMPVRKALGIRTIFNLLGPLANPAGARRQLLGVYDDRWLEPMAQVLEKFGAERVWVVHGNDGLDEISVSAPTDITALEDGEIKRFAVTPEQLGFERHPLDALKGGGPDQNAEVLLAMLSGQTGAYRDVSLMNAAATLLIADRADDLQQAVALARDSLDTGAAKRLLEDWGMLTRQAAKND